MAYKPISRQRPRNKTTAVARQQILNKQQLNYNNTGTAGNCVSTWSVQRGYIMRTPAGSVVSSKSVYEEKTRRLV
jgi:hypothetical protein